MIFANLFEMVILLVSDHHVLKAGISVVRVKNFRATLGGLRGHK